MAIRALNLTDVRKYVSDLDPAKGQPNEGTEATVWHLGTLDSRVQGYLGDQNQKFMVSQSQLQQGNDTVETALARNGQAFARVQFGLRGWERFTDAEGNDIPFKTQEKSLPGSSKSYKVVPDYLVSMIPPEIVSELSDQIMKAQEVPAAEKND